jgi:hypothetical protein
MILVIAIDKKELDKHPGLDPQLINLSYIVKEVNKIRVYYPLSGQLIAFVNLLKRHQILYDLKMRHIHPTDVYPLSS